MCDKKIKLIIESKLDNVSLIGMAVNKLCSSVPLSDIESYQIELCIVEAVTNSIIHAYEKEAGHDVEVVFTLDKSRLTFDVYDTGKPLSKKIISEKSCSTLEVDPDDLAGLAEGGRGLAIINEVMDQVEYRTEKGKNCFTMTKKIRFDA